MLKKWKKSFWVDKTNNDWKEGYITFQMNQDWKNVKVGSKKVNGLFI